jgi:rSAM/selenodomain-associated transferase 1
MNAVIVFAKRPRAGEVKSRLAAEIGPEAAAELYRALAEAEIDATRPQGSEYQRLFFFAPADARPDMEAWMPGETWLAQEGADLGARMANAFAEAFRRGAERVAIIGTDVPWVARETVLAAFRALDGDDVVLGPAHDGGYYLMALKTPRPALFEGIAWSTSSVLAATLARCVALGLSVRQLEPLTDIDTLEDVRSAWGRLEVILNERAPLATAAIVLRLSAN